MKIAALLTILALQAPQYTMHAVHECTTSNSVLLAQTYGVQSAALITVHKSCDAKQ